MKHRENTVVVYRDPRPLLAQKIRMCREAQGLSLRRLSGMIGVDRTVLNDIELGRGNPRITTLAKIASGLEIPLSELLIEDER